MNVKNKTLKCFDGYEFYVHINGALLYLNVLYQNLKSLY